MINLKLYPWSRRFIFKHKGKEKKKKKKKIGYTLILCLPVGIAKVATLVLVAHLGKKHAHQGS